MIENTLEERGSKYGEFKDNAALAQAIKDELRSHAGWDELTPIHREALDLIVLKMVRIVNGDASYKDNWHDIQGYAKLAESECKGES